jgi:predicted lipoprotein with Yx(FWY)xxD motif
MEDCMRVRMVSMARLVVVAFVVAAALAGSARASEGEVKVATDPKLGEYLTDGKGMALYVFVMDSRGKSACAGECLVAWPAFHAEDVGAAGGLKPDDFGTLTREDGKKQTTYRGLPLYYWAKDKKPGDTTGHGVNDVWRVARP